MKLDELQREAKSAPSERGAAVSSVAIEHQRRLPDAFSKCGFISVFIALYTLLSVPGRAQEFEVQTRTLVTIEELKSACALRDGAARTQATWMLTGLGETAIPPILGALSDAVGQFRTDLLYAIGRMRGDKAASALLELAASNDDEGFRTAALSFLQHRPIRRPVTSREKATLIERSLQCPSALGAASAADVLAHCYTIPAEERAGVIVTRLLKEAAVPAKTREPLMHGLTHSRKVYELYQFIIALEAVDDRESVLSTLKEYAGTDAANDVTVAKWLLIAQGFAGSIEAAKPLKELFEQESDQSVKSIALRAYARSAGCEAIPLLEQYVKERTSEDFSLMWRRPRDPLDVAARAELARLRSRGTE